MADDSDEAPFTPPDLPHNPPPHEDALLQREKNLSGKAGLTLEGLHDRLSRLEEKLFGTPPSAVEEPPAPGFEADDPETEQQATGYEQSA